MEREEIDGIFITVIEDQILYKKEKKSIKLRTIKNNGRKCTILYSDEIMLDDIFRYVGNNNFTQIRL